MMGKHILLAVSKESVIFRGYLIHCEVCVLNIRGREMQSGNRTRMHIPANTLNRSSQHYYRH